MSRVALASIRSLTLHKGEVTKARRIPPVQQLKCVGSACKLFQPDVVRCFNAGGAGTDVDWTCEADLPEKLRFGRVDVSCEGWDHPGDPYVLKGSCGLEYRLVRLSDPSKGFSEYLTFENAFTCFVIGLVIYFLYIYLKPALTGSGQTPGGGPPHRPHRPGSGGSGGFFGGGSNSYPPNPPPPYSETPKPSSSSQPGGSSGSAGGYRPGFWTGLGLGGLGTAMMNRAFRGNDYRDQFRRGPYYEREYDWERTRRSQGGWFGSSFFNSDNAAPVVARRRNSDRGEGSSRSTNLGSMRRSTGYGTTNVR